MIIVAGSSNPSLSQKIATNLSLPIFVANTQKFADQELKIKLKGNFLNQDIIIIQSTAKPANDHLMELLLLVDFVKQAGAKRIIAVIAYFGYSRQNKEKYAYEPASVSLIAKLIEASGIDDIITLDLHSEESKKLFNINIKNIDAAPLFLPLISKQNNNIIISPDKGAIKRAKKLAKLLNAEFTVINKLRNKDGICISELMDDVTGKDCILIDDIIDTGETIYAASKLLLEKGAKSITAYITHAVLSSGCIDKIENSPIKKIYVSDSVNQQKLPSKFKIISAMDVLANAIREELKN